VIAQAAVPTDLVARGRSLALLACTSCHVVTPDQPFPPIFRGSPRPPDFNTIANMPNTTAESLRAYLTSLPDVPPLSSPPRMPNPDLTGEELDEVVAFIMSLRVQH